MFQNKLSNRTTIGKWVVEVSDLVVKAVAFYHTIRFINLKQNLQMFYDC